MDDNSFCGQCGNGVLHGYKTICASCREKFNPDTNTKRTDKQVFLDDMHGLKDWREMFGKESIRCRGRNGYFKLSWVDVYPYMHEDNVTLSFYSNSPHTKNAPITIQGTKADIQQALKSMLELVNTNRGGIYTNG